jgi:cation diffusion facilitator family transporter
MQNNSLEHGKEKHGHTHGPLDPSITSTKKGLWAVKWSFIGLVITFIIQAVIVFFTNSIALLADTIHNLGDAITAIPLGIAFLFSTKKPSKRFTYGYGRVEDLAGIIIVFIILFSAIGAGYQAVYRIINPQTMQNVWAVIIASIIGFIGNEAVANFRIRIGKEIGSAALVADGYHARIDGFTSLAVLFGAIGVILGFPLTDPIVGLLITLIIFKIVWDSAKTVFTRFFDGVEPEIFDEIKHSLNHVKGIKEVLNIKARWSGHQLFSEVCIRIDSSLNVMEAHGIIEEIKHKTMHHIKYISSIIVDIEPDNHPRNH